MKKNPQQNKLRIGLQTRKMRKTEKGVNFPFPNKVINFIGSESITTRSVFFKILIKYMNLFFQSNKRCTTINFAAFHLKEEFHPVVN